MMDYGLIIKVGSLLFWIALYCSYVITAKCFGWQSGLVRGVRWATAVWVGAVVAIITSFFVSLEWLRMMESAKDSIFFTIGHVFLTWLVVFLSYMVVARIFGYPSRWVRAMLFSVGIVAWVGISVLGWTRFI